MAVEHKPHLTVQAQKLIQEHFEAKKIMPKLAIDATCGNGFDTVFLARLVKKHIYAFDIQELALNNTLQKLCEQNLQNKVKLIHSGHENMTECVKQAVDIIMFNFGYLPQADKSITTLTTTSLQALKSAFDLLSKDGILSLLCYPGHEEGRKETTAIFLLTKNSNLVPNNL